MESIEQSVIDQISRMAESLPERPRQQLLELVESWRADVRQAPRESYTEALSISSDSGNYFGQAKDVSATGVFVETTAKFAIGDRVKLMLTFISAPNPLRLSGSVVRISDDGIAVHFDDASQSQVRELDSIIAKHALILRSR